MYVSPLFSDHMVLQREKPVRIWGCGEGHVTVCVGDYSAETVCNDGKWLAELPPMPAGGPYTMILKDAVGEVVLTDVMIGEVWLAAGQSNMEHPVFSSEDGFAAAEAADLPDVRFFTVPRRNEPGQDRYGWHFEAVRSVDTPWEVCTPETALHFSAIGFYFARCLQAEKGVPVGVISCNFGGTRIEPWVDPAIVESDPRFARVRERAAAALDGLDLAEYEAVYQAYRDEMDAQCEGTDAVAKARELGPYAFGRHNCIDWPKEPPFGPKWQNWPGVLYANMTASIVPYALRGVLWYQGESSNVDFLYYYDMFAAYVEQCRRDFRDDSLPIFTVQLAPYNSHPVGWARFVVQQVRIAQEQEGVYLITSGDIGEQGNIHPMYKRQFGERLWLAADKVVYGGDAEYCGPIYKSHRIAGDTVAVTFTHADNGLEIKDTPDLAVCGEDGVFHPATATVEGSTLLVRSSEVANPVHIRHGFADQFRLSLFNGDGLPAAPFRTDSFEV